MKLIRFDDDNVTEEDLSVYNIVLAEAGKYGVDPSCSVDSETFFINMVADFTGKLDMLPEWLRIQIPKHFMSINKRPRWLQNSEWPFFDGHPMIFAGQIDLLSESQNIPEFIAGTSSIYVFLAENTSPVAILQQS